MDFSISERQEIVKNKSCFLTDRWLGCDTQYCFLCLCVELLLGFPSSWVSQGTCKGGCVCVFSFGLGSSRSSYLKTKVLVSATKRHGRCTFFISSYFLLKTYLSQSYFCSCMEDANGMVEMSKSYVCWNSR